MRVSLMLAGCLALAGCEAPTPDPDPNTLPEPEAKAGALRQAINEPLDKAKAVEAEQADDEAQRQETMKDIGG